VAEIEKIRVEALKIGCNDWVMFIEFSKWDQTVAVTDFEMFREFLEYKRALDKM